MRRFFRSAAFPILIVIVLAFFAQKLISGPSSTPPTTYSEFLAQDAHKPSSIKDVTFQPKTNDIQVSENNGDSYTVGYPNNVEPKVQTLLQKHGVAFNSEGTGGSSLF